MRVVLATIVFALSQNVAAAETPPASCAARFIGDWSTTILATGQNYPQRADANGVGHSFCPFCNDGTWTCSGTTYFWSVNGLNGSGTLSPDGRTISGAGFISKRSGPNNPTVAAQPAPPAKQAKGCVVPGNPQPTVCAGTSIAKDCRCYPYTNICKTGVIVQYSRVGRQTRPEVLHLGGGQTDRVSVCTSEPTESVQYIGWKSN